MVNCINNACWRALENSLTPLPKEANCCSRLFHHLSASLYFPAALVTGAVQLAWNLVSLPFSCCCRSKLPHPDEDFTSVLKDSRQWELLGDIEAKTTLGQKNPDFLIGTATCTYQDSGSHHCPDSQWARWEQSCITDLANRSGRASNLYGLYKTPTGRAEVIDRLQKLGVNAYRFNIEWSQVEPKQGTFNEEALEPYLALCRDLKAAGIEPVVTLHHFSEPVWFHDKGSFEKEENIPHFARFAEFVFDRLSREKLTSHICTINEPAIEAFSRYVRGAFSPGYKMRFSRAGHFIKGALKAHNVVYRRLKAINENVKVGIVHQRLKFEASNTLTYPVVRTLNQLVNDCVIDCFKNDRFELKIPFSCHIVEPLKIETDFVGVQCYVRPVIGFTGSTSYHEPMTNMPFREDPEAIYEAIVEVFEAAKVPIMVTENGISTDDEEQRARYMARALYATERAGEEIGEENLLGYLQWCFTNNFEWDMGMHPQSFGAYNVENGLISRKPREGMAPFIRVANAWKRAQSSAAA